MTYFNNAVIKFAFCLLYLASLQFPCQLAEGPVTAKYYFGSRVVLLRVFFLQTLKNNATGSAVVPLTAGKYEANFSATVNRSFEVGAACRAFSLFTEIKIFVNSFSVF